MGIWSTREGQKCNNGSNPGQREKEAVGVFTLKCNVI